MLPGFDLDGGGSGGSFFLCTETWPRCFVIKQVNDIDGALKEVKQSEKEEKIPNYGETLLAPNQQSHSSNNCNNASPCLPMLPWWFTAECRHQLFSVPGPEQFRSNTPERPPSSICGAISMNEEQLRARLKRQLEFYFSRENLINDRYLRCQMDADQYVPIKIVANFPKVAQLSTDFDLIVDVLKSSSHVQVDESSTKVRPMSKRCTIILREIPQNADENEVKSMFKSENGNCPPYLSLAYGLNDSWYVTFQTEEETQQAFFHLQTLGKTFNGKPVFARIKNGGAPIGADPRHSPDVHQNLNFSETGLNGQLIIHELDIERSTTPNSQYLRPCEKEVDLTNTNNIHSTEIEEMRKRKASASSSATNNIINSANTSPAPFNLGQILAKFGYVPRATFRPNIPPPNSSVLPPLQPTTTGIGALMNGLPQPTSYFTQPILRNDGFIQNIICPHFDLILQQQQQFEEEQFLFQMPQHYQRKNREEKDASNFEHNDDEHNCCDESSEDDDEKDENETISLQSSLIVGQNENIIRQQAKESGFEVSPVLVPNSVPRITDIPRINGKGASSLPNSQVNVASAITSSTTRRISSPPPQTPIGGGGFKGFQRQESVEAYQLAMAANELNKQKRLQVEDKIDEKIIDKDTKNQKSIRANSTEQMLQLFNCNDLRRSEPPPLFSNKNYIQQLRPLSSATISLNWRQPEVNINKKSKQQKHSVDIRTIQQQQWKQQQQTLNLSQQQLQYPSTLITRNVQPLLSLGQSLNSMGMSSQQQPYSFNQIGQMQSNRGGKVFDRNKPNYVRDQSTQFKGINNNLQNSYRTGTWATINNNDWLGTTQQQQNNNNNGFSSVVRFQNDLEQWQGINKNVNNSSGTRKKWGGENNSAIVSGGGIGIKNIMRRSASEYNNIQQQKNNKLFQQQQEENNYIRLQQQRKVRPPFANNRRESNRQPSHRFPSEVKENEPFNTQMGLRNLKQLDIVEEQKIEHQSTGYNFEEHVEEFPALSLSQLNSRKASECHSEQPSPSSPKLILEQQQKQQYLIKQPFSAIVSGNGRPRRATIGTSTATTINICTSNINRKMNEDEENTLLTTAKIGEQQQQQKETSSTRSDTISGSDGRQLLLLGQRRSYAQVMLKRSGGDCLAAENDGSTSAVEKKKKEEEQSNESSDYPPICTFGTEV